MRTGCTTNIQQETSNRPHLVKYQPKSCFQVFFDVFVGENQSQLGRVQRGQVKGQRSAQQNKVFDVVSPFYKYF